MAMTMPPVVPLPGVWKKRHPPARAPAPGVRARRVSGEAVTWVSVRIPRWKPSSCMWARNATSLLPVRPRTLAVMA